MTIQSHSVGGKRRQKTESVLGTIFKIIPLKQQFVPLPTACLLLCCNNVLQKATTARKRRGMKRHDHGFLRARQYWEVMEDSGSERGRQRMRRRWNLVHNWPFSQLHRWTQTGQSECSICQLWTGSDHITAVLPWISCNLFRFPSFQAGSMDFKLFVVKRWLRGTVKSEALYLKETYILYLSKIKCWKVEHYVVSKTVPGSSFPTEPLSV